MDTRTETTTSFQPISFLRRIFMSLPALEVYYRERRKHRFAQGKPLKHIRLREAFYPVFAKFLSLDRFFRKQTVTVIGDRKNYQERVIFACTHIWENDLENIYEMLGRSCWWFVGDPCVLYKDISGLLVYLNGCIFLDTGDKEDRHIAYLRSVELLKGGGSLMIFPEGARNGSVNLPVMPLFPGTAKMAMESGTKIVPVAIEQYGKRFVVKLGAELHPNEFDTAGELTQVLRDALATLKWDIWEQEAHIARNTLPPDYGKQFYKSFEQCLAPWDTLETVERTRFHTKAEIEHMDAFAHLENLVPCRENAFLLRKR